MDNQVDWRKLTVSRRDDFQHLDSIYCATKQGENNSAVFSTVKEFMVFAAMVGFQLGLYKPLTDKVNTTQISLDTYNTTNHDTYIYLLALAHQPNLELLKDKNLKETIAIFEGYCNGGLEEIKRWNADSVSNRSPQNILFNNTLEYLIEYE